MRLDRPCTPVRRDPPAARRSASACSPRWAGSAARAGRRDDQLHLTLRFIGEVDRHQAEDVHAALGAIRQPPFEITLAGVGCFEHARPAGHGLGRRRAAGAARGAAQQGRSGAGPRRRLEPEHARLSCRTSPSLASSRAAGPIGGLLEQAGDLASAAFHGRRASALFESDLTAERRGLFAAEPITRSAERRLPKRGALLAIGERQKRGCNHGDDRRRRRPIPSRARKPAAPRIGAYAWYALFVLVLVYIINFVDRQILSILVGDIKRDLDVTDAQIGFLYGTAFAVFYALFGIPLGRLADSWYRGRLMAMGLALWSSMTVFSGFATSFGMLAAARIGVGIGEASASPAAYSMISDSFPKERRATALSIYSSGLYIGGALSLPIGGLRRRALERGLSGRRDGAARPGRLAGRLPRGRLAGPAARASGC